MIIKMWLTSEQAACTLAGGISALRRVTSNCGNKLVLATDLLLGWLVVENESNVGPAQAPTGALCWLPSPPVSHCHGFYAVRGHNV